MARFFPRNGRKHHGLGSCQSRSKTGQLSGGIILGGAGLGAPWGVRFQVAGARQGALGEGQFLGDWSGFGSGFRLAPLPEPEALAVHFENVDVVGQAVENCAGVALGAEALGKFRRP